MRLGHYHGGRGQVLNYRKTFQINPEKLPKTFNAVKQSICDIFTQIWMKKPLARIVIWVMGSSKPLTERPPHESYQRSQL